MKLLITGGAGFLGFHIANDLADRGAMPGLAAVFLSGRGCARRSELVEAGFTPHAISSMVRSGEIERVRIGWYVPRGADPMLRQAVRVGGRLACVSDAGHIGLWVTE